MIRQSLIPVMSLLLLVSGSGTAVSQEDPADVTFSNPGPPPLHRIEVAEEDTDEISQALMRIYGVDCIPFSAGRSIYFRATEDRAIEIEKTAAELADRAMLARQEQAAKERVLAEKVQRDGMMERERQRARFKLQQELTDKDASPLQVLAALTEGIPVEVLSVGTPNRPSGVDETVWRELQQSEERCRKLAQELRELPDDSDDGKRDKLTQSLQEAINRAFDMRQEGQERAAGKLRERLEAIESRLNQRQQLRNRIVERRLQELLGDPDPTSWFSHQPGFSGPYRTRTPRSIPVPSLQDPELPSSDVAATSRMARRLLEAESDYQLAQNALQEAKMKFDMGIGDMNELRFKGFELKADRAKLVLELEQQGLEDEVQRASSLLTNLQEEITKLARESSALPTASQRAAARTQLRQLTGQRDTAARQIRTHRRVLEQLGQRIRTTSDPDQPDQTQSSPEDDGDGAVERFDGRSEDSDTELTSDRYASESS